MTTFVSSSYYDLFQHFLLHMSIKIITAFLIGIILGSATMLWFLYAEFRQLKDFGQCLAEKTIILNGESELLLWDVSECYNKNIK